MTIYIVVDEAGCPDQVYLTRRHAQDRVRELEDMGIEAIIWEKEVIPAS